MNTRYPVPARTQAASSSSPLRWLAVLVAFLAAGTALASEPESTNAVCGSGAAERQVPYCESERPISDFLDAQGRYDIGFRFVPPVPNFFTWIDPVEKLGLAIDYAGLADAACGGVARTQISGRVCERPMFDGRTEVTVDLHALDAMTWAITGFDFRNDPVIFGERWEEGSEGGCLLRGPVTTGSAMLQVKFIQPEAGAELPDLLQLFLAPEPDQELLSLSLHAEAIGELADGTPARAAAHQVVTAQKPGDLVFVVQNVVVGKLP